MTPEEIEEMSATIELAEHFEQLIPKKETARDYGSVRGPVDPAITRDGTFIRSFALRERMEMIGWCAETKKAMRRNKITGELVFTRRTWMWYVYLIRSE